MLHNEAVIDSFSQEDLESIRNEKDFDVLTGILRDKGYDLIDTADLAKNLDELGLFTPSIALYEGGLRLNIQDESIDDVEFHAEVHSRYGNCICKIGIDNVKHLEEIGIPIRRIGIKFNRERGFFCPGMSDPNTMNHNYKSLGMKSGLLNGLGHLQYDLCEQFHKPDECPYVKRIDKK